MGAKKSFLKSFLIAAAIAAALLGVLLLVVLIGEGTPTVDLASPFYVRGSIDISATGIVGAKTITIAIWR